MDTGMERRLLPADLEGRGARIEIGVWADGEVLSVLREE